MEPRLLKSAALIVVAVLAGACVPGKLGTGCSRPDPPNGGPEPAPLSPDPTDDKQSPDPTDDKQSPDPTDGKQKEPSSDPLTNSTPLTGAEAQPKRPWAHNTGPSDPEALRSSGSVRITTDGAAYENLDVTGTIEIDADDVTIRNFRIEATSHYGIRIVDGHHGIVLEDGEIFGMNGAAILGVGFSARRLHIHDSNSDGLKVQGTGGPTVVEACFIEKLGRSEKAHADGNQTRGGSNITFRYNNIYMPYPGTPNYPGAPYKSNAAFMLSLKNSNFVIERNWLTGGSYTIYSTGGVSVRDNIFGRENGGLRFGKEDRRIRNGEFDEWSGNRWEDTGDPI